MKKLWQLCACAAGVLAGEYAHLTLTAEELYAALEDFPVILEDSLPTSRHPLRPRGLLTMNAKQLSSYGGSLETAVTDLEHYRSSGSAVLVLCGGETRAKNLHRLLEEKGELLKALGGETGARLARLDQQLDELEHQRREVGEAISSFGVLFGMTMPLLMLPSAFIGALCLAIVPKLTQCCALGNRRACQQKVGKAVLATSVLVLPAMGLMIPLGPALGAALFQDPRAGEHIIPLAAGVALSCYQSVLSAVLNGMGRQRQAMASSLFCGAIQLAFTYVGTGIPGVGLYGYILGFVVSSAAAVALNLLLVSRCVGMKVSWFQALWAPGLAALLMGLCVNLLFQALLTRGMAALAAAAACAVLGGIQYLTALRVQGVEPLKLFHLR